MGFVWVLDGFIEILADFSGISMGFNILKLKWSLTWSTGWSDQFDRCHHMGAPSRSQPRATAAWSRRMGGLASLCAADAGALAQPLRKVNWMITGSYPLVETEYGVTSNLFLHLRTTTGSIPTCMTPSIVAFGLGSWMRAIENSIGDCSFLGGYTT